VPLVLPDLTVELETDRGVFSFGRIDAGTKLLLQEAPPPPVSGVLVDLGCGYGPIAVALGMRAPETTIWAVDVNVRAVQLTTLNAAENHVVNVTAVLADQVPDFHVDALYSNPPIRIGKPALLELLDHWMPRTSVAYLVVQKHLGSDSLARWMADDRGWHVERLLSRGGYRILRVAP
jgi:16S rRNA (guanine1207-N2)-methyltransferase